MTQRAFVLLPLTEIAPNWIEPVSGMTIAQLFYQLQYSEVSRSAGVESRNCCGNRLENHLRGQLQHFQPFPLAILPIHCYNYNF